MMRCDEMGNAFLAEELDKALRFGLPYEIYRDAFICDDGERSATECSNILSALMRAAIWGADNREHVITVNELINLEESERMDHLEDDE